MASPAGTITNPGVAKAPPNKTELTLVDTFGDTAKTECRIIRTASTDDDITLMLAQAAMSNAGINNAHVVVTLQRTKGTPETGSNESVSTKAIFTFIDPTTLIPAHYQIPAPHANIFEADGITVNQAQTQVAAYFTALAAIGTYSDGSAIIPDEDIQEAYRFQKKGALPHKARFRE